MPHVESHKRSVAKSITFRILVIISDTIITYALTHKVEIVIGFVLFTNIASTVLYYAHERVWSAADWGHRN